MLPPGSPLPGIPVPLFSLVYHDCMVVPWIMDKTQNRDNMLYALLNGGIPYLVREGAYPNVDGAFEKEKTDIENDIARCHIVQKLHERVAYCRMTDFALLNKTGTTAAGADGRFHAIVVCSGCWLVRSLSILSQSM